jgi:hypothetical protein
LLLSHLGSEEGDLTDRQALRGGAPPEEGPRVLTFNTGDQAEINRCAARLRAAAADLSFGTAAQGLRPPGAVSAIAESAADWPAPDAALAGGREREPQAKSQAFLQESGEQAQVLLDSPWAWDACSDAAHGFLTARLERPEMQPSEYCSLYARDLEAMQAEPQVGAADVDKLRSRAASNTRRSVAQKMAAVAGAAAKPVAILVSPASALAALAKPATILSTSPSMALAAARAAASSVGSAVGAAAVDAAARMEATSSALAEDERPRGPPQDGSAHDAALVGVTTALTARTSAPPAKPLPQSFPTAAALVETIKAPPTAPRASPPAKEIPPLVAPDAASPPEAVLSAAAGGATPPAASDTVLVAKSEAQPGALDQDVPAEPALESAIAPPALATETASAFEAPVSEGTPEAATARASLNGTDAASRTKTVFAAMDVAASTVDTLPATEEDELAGSPGSNDPSSDSELPAAVSPSEGTATTAGSDDSSGEDGAAFWSGSF